MKATKRILVMIMSLCLILGCVFTTSLAEEQPGGSITIQNQSGTNATVAGKTFNLFKIFSAVTSKDGANISYSWCVDKYGKTFEDFFKTGEYDYLATPGNTINDVVEELSKMESQSYELSQFASAIHEYVHQGNDTFLIQPVATKTADANAVSVTFDNLGLGYYMVYDATDFSGSEETAAVRSAAMLTTNKQNVTISLKANRPSVKKQVLENDGVTYGKGTSSNIGEDVKFKITTHIPSHKHYGSTYDFYLEDTLDAGLTLKENTIKVYRTSTDGTEDELLTEGQYYKLTTPTDGNEDFKIDFSEFLGHENDKYSANDEVYVIYQATVNGNAQKMNTNTVKLTYSNDPNATGSHGSSTDEAYVYSYQFVFTKFAQDTSGNFLNKRLAGAEFQLYRVNGTGEDILIKFTTRTIPAENGFNAYTQYVVAETENETTTTLVVHGEGEETTTITGNNFGGHLGDISIFGLAEGTYKLVETKAPDGYVLPEAPFIIKVTDQIDSYGTVGVVTVSTEHDGKGGIVNAQGKGEQVMTVWAEITNKPGAMLPETGGMGTTLFTMLGIIMMAGAVGFFSTRKRNSMA